MLTLNSANSLISQLPEFSSEVLCGIFNSKLAQFYFSKKFNTFKVLRAHIENFPLPKVNNKIFKQIKAKVLQLEKKHSVKEVADLDRLVLSLYKLSNNSTQQVNDFATSKAFING